MPYSLRLLGGAQIEADGAPVRGRAAHRRRLALLALLSTAKQAAVSRDKLIGHLWPEHAGEAARHLLSESLYVLRKELGEGAIVAVGDSLRLDPEAVQSDVATFEAACDAGDLEAAAALYTGPFLDGWYVDDAPEFERWADSQRDRLARRYAAALEQLAKQRESAGDWHGAAKVWRDLLAADPFSSRVTSQLILSLQKAGEHGAALQFAAAHRAAMKEEFGVDADAEVLALVKKIRAQNPTPNESASDAPMRQVTDASGLPTVPELAIPAMSPSPVPQAPPTKIRSWAVQRRVGLAIAGACFAIAVLGASLARAFATASTSSRATQFDPRNIAVLFFTDDSPARDLEYLASGLTQSLINALASVKGIHVLSREAVRPFRDRTVPFDSLVGALHVGSVVEGSVQRSGDRIRVRVQLVEIGAGRTISATVEHGNSDLFELEDDVTRQLEALLRHDLGEVIRLQSTSRGTQNVNAREFVLRGTQIAEDASEVATHEHPLDAGSAIRMLATADSMLALAERADPAWLEPIVERGRVAIDLGRLAYADSRDSILSIGLGHAERAVAKAPHDAAALEVRGTLLWRRATATDGSPTRAADVERAGRDLHAAVAEDPSRASAWATLSQYLRFQGNIAEADLAARRALDEDAYLRNAADIYDQLFRSAYSLGDIASAKQWCARGHAAFAADWRFTECNLTLMVVDAAAKPDPDAAWALVRTLSRMDPASQALAAGHSFNPIYRMMAAAAISARAGQRDSAQAVIAWAHRQVAGNLEMTRDLYYDEAYVRLALGERQRAIALLTEYLGARANLKQFVLQRDPVFVTLRSELAKSIR